ncbi:hypothetical protein O6H91_21G038600 [Diphasiastrum complanatum]|uniref:Uncharacterized protein n=1 Tax=Diphasiastrum complanatum TaxID=34168 RepID=A0ACC2AJH7_DIPCM|nr:hypothetical protein O6H91_21G038600 [Diphasiastrum complanatum]
MHTLCYNFSSCPCSIFYPKNTLTTPIRDLFLWQKSVCFLHHSSRMVLTRSMQRKLDHHTSVTSIQSNPIETEFIISEMSNQTDNSQVEDDVHPLQEKQVVVQDESLSEIERKNLENDLHEDLHEEEEIIETTKKEEKEMMMN